MNRKNPQSDSYLEGLANSICEHHNGGADNSIGGGEQGDDPGSAYVYNKQAAPPPCIAFDIHSRLNVVRHRKHVDVRSVSDMATALTQSRIDGAPIIVAGGRHAMGGQQFAHDGVLLDSRNFNKVIHFNSRDGLITLEPGIMWSELIQSLHALQEDRIASNQSIWSIGQKPTGADNITIGGSLSANIHGRGLCFKPFVQDIEEFELLTTDGQLVKVSRCENPELFRLASGGYGLFGLLTSVTLRLRRRQVMRRIVETTTIDQLIANFNERIRAGHEYGDFQFAIDNDSDDFLNRGILSTYVADDACVPDTSQQSRLSIEEWKRLLLLAHIDKSKAFKDYESHYLKTNGQLYYSDTMQLSTYLDDYHVHLDREMGALTGTEVISELYVPREELAVFMGGAGEFLRKERGNVIYGTIRLTEKDDETYLPWARESYACIIFNLHTEHSPSGMAKSARLFTGLIDLAQRLNGSFYLTYHRFADRDLIERSYPRFQEFLKEKLKHDPDEIIQSQWYRHYRSVFSS